jgi:hypothetical protein
MTAIGTPREQSEALHRGDPGLGAMLYVDVRVRSLLLGEARKRAVTRAFGTAHGDQSYLVTAILLGAAATAVRDLAPRPFPRPSRTGAAIGGSVVNAALRGIAGEPSRTVPLAGALIAFGLLSHSLRPAIAGSAREVRGLTRELRAAFGARYAR